MSLSVSMYSNRLSTCFAVIATLAQIAKSQTVTITNGTINGINDPVNNVQRFLGIPYAQPPVGNLRLHQSIPLESSFGTLNATAFGPACYGKNNPDPSEDCLTLNIWRPSNASSRAKDTLLPVLVWLYGGGLSSGYTVSSHRELRITPFLMQSSYRRIRGLKARILFKYRPRSTSLLSSFQWYVVLPCSNKDCSDKLLELSSRTSWISQWKANVRFGTAELGHVGPASCSALDPGKYQGLWR